MLTPGTESDENPKCLPPLTLTIDPRYCRYTISGIRTKDHAPHFAIPLKRTGKPGKRGKKAPGKKIGCIPLTRSVNSTAPPAAGARYGVVRKHTAHGTHNGTTTVPSGSTVEYHRNRKKKPNTIGKENRHYAPTTTCIPTSANTSRPPDRVDIAG